MMIEIYNIAGRRPLKFKNRIIGQFSDAYWIKKEGKFSSHCMINEKYKNLIDLTKKYLVVDTGTELILKEKNENILS